MAYIGNGIGRNQVVAGQIAPDAVDYIALDDTVTAGLATFKNVLINGNFDVWQRGGSFPAATTFRYTADRWISSGVGSTLAVSLQSAINDIQGIRSFMRVTTVSSAGAGNYAVIAQRIEGAQTLAGKQVVVSFWAKADAAKPVAINFGQNFGTGGSPSAAVNDVGPTKIDLTTTWARYSATVTLPSIAGKTLGTNGNDFVTFNIFLDAGSNYNSGTASLGQRSGTFDFSQIQIEAGSIATTYDWRPVQVELALCQRYYQAGTVFSIASTPNSDSYSGGSQRYSVTMRAIPTLTYMDLSGNASKITSNTGGANQSITAGGVSATYAHFQWDFVLGAPSGNWVSFNWTATAEL